MPFKYELTLFDGNVVLKFEEPNIIQINSEYCVKKEQPFIEGMIEEYHRLKNININKLE